MKNKGDVRILSEISEKKYLTVLQISLLCNRSEQVIRRRLRYLLSNGLISVRERVFSRSRGRKGHILSITLRGLEALKKEEALSNNAAYITDETPNILSVEHEILTNWFQVGLKKMIETDPSFKVVVLTTSSHLLNHGSPDKPFIMETLVDPDCPKNRSTLIPDGVILITLKKTRKTLLYFLEVDMGSETLVSISGKSNDLMQKIQKYQRLFKNKTYSKYNEIANYKLNGFRLLFLTATESRKISICRLVENAPPSDFIWVTDKDSMMNHGVSDKIWARGGRLSNSPKSILNEKFSFKTPIIPYDPVQKV